MRLSIASFAHHLRAIRVGRGLTQVELSLAIGRHRHTVAHWESGRNCRVRYDDVKKCAKALRCRVRDLMAPEEAPSPPLPTDWPAVRRRIKQYAATLTGRRPRPPRRTQLRADPQAQDAGRAAAGGRSEPPGQPRRRAERGAGDDLVAGLCARVLAGEITWTEARAAAIEAGIRRPTTPPALERVRSLLAQCSYEDLQALMTDMIGQMKSDARTAVPPLAQFAGAPPPHAGRRRCPRRRALPRD